ERVVADLAPDEPEERGAVLDEEDVEAVGGSHRKRGRACGIVLPDRRTAPAAVTPGATSSGTDELGVEVDVHAFERLRDRAVHLRVLGVALERLVVEAGDLGAGVEVDAGDLAL